MEQRRALPSRTRETSTSPATALGSITACTTPGIRKRANNACANLAAEPAVQAPQQAQDPHAIGYAGRIVDHSQNDPPDASSVVILH